MSKKLGSLAAILLAATIFASAQLCWAADGKGVSDYVAIALEKSPSIVAAKLALEKSDIDMASLRLQDSLLSSKQLEIQSKKSARTFEAAKRDLALNVETSYIGVLKAQKSLEIAQQSASQAQAQLAMVKARFDQKAASKLDLISATKQEKSAGVSLRRAQNAVASARTSFQKLVGSTDPVALADIKFDDAKVDFTADQAVKMALEKSPDIEYARYDLELANIQKSLTDNDFSTANEKRKAQIAVTEAQMDLDQKLSDVAQRASDLYTNVQNALDQIDIANGSVEYAQENLRVMNLRYQAGLETMSSLINAQISLNQANIDLLDANASYKTAVSTLRSFVGQLDAK